MIRDVPVYRQNAVGRKQIMYSADKQVGIRLFEVDDVARKVEWINNPQNNQYLHYDIPLSFDKTRDWFYQKNNAVRWDCVIEYQGIPVGLIGLLAIDSVSAKAEFYISMGETCYKRKGIATEATKLVLAQAFEQLGLNKVYLNVDADNHPACLLYEKVGFACEGYFKQDLMHRGVLVDRKRYAMLKEDYDLLDR